MPLDIKVTGDPLSIRETASWLASAASSVHDAGTQVYGARGDSESGWHGPAGEGFRGAMGQAGAKVDGLGDDLTGTGEALVLHADDLDTVKSRMTQAREIAGAAGLPATETTISEPGAAPAAPTPLPSERPASPAEQQAHTAATQAQSAYATQVQAYNDAATVVAEARGKEVASQGALNRFLGGQAQKAPLTVTDFGGGLAALSINRTSKFRARAQMFADRAAERARLARSGGLTSFVRNTVAKEYNLYKQNAALTKATPTAWSRGLDRLPRWAKNGLTAQLSKTTPVLRRIPVAGTVITAIGVGTDIAQGKNAVQSTVSGVSSLAAGAAVGAAIGGPVGLVAGAVVGAGVGFVVDEWGDDIARGAGEVGGAIGDAFGGAADKIGGLFD